MAWTSRAARVQSSLPTQRKERWLVEHDISFERQSDAKYELDGTLTMFRPSLGIVELTATQEGDPTVRVAEVERVRRRVRAALRERSPEKVRAASAALDEALGPRCGRCRRS